MNTDQERLKECRRCYAFKPLADFHKWKHSPNGDGYCYYCKECACAYKRELYKTKGAEWGANRAEYFREYREINKERLNVQARMRYAKKHGNVKTRKPREEKTKEVVVVTKLLLDTLKEAKTPEEITGAIKAASTLIQETEWKAH